MSKILIIEDERHTADTIALYLEQQGFECLKAYDGQEGISCLLRQPVELIILDWMLPGLSGIEICQVAKSMGNVKVLMLSARTSISDKVTGLDVGADDYLVKPFSLRELNARVRTLLRKSYTTAEAVQDKPIGEMKLQFADGALILNKDGVTARFNGRELALTLTEFKILYLLAERSDRVLTKEEIVEELYSTEARVDLHTITVHLSNLRTKLRELTNFQVVKTVYGIGYKLNGVCEPEVRPS